MSDPVTAAELPGWFVEHEQRLAAVESELKFLKNLWMLRAFAVPLPRHAPRDPRLLSRQRQRGHL